MAGILMACRGSGQLGDEVPAASGTGSYESVEGTQIKMITDNAEVVITLNGSRAAADLVAHGANGGEHVPGVL